MAFSRAETDCSASKQGSNSEGCDLHGRVMQEAGVKPDSDAGKTQKVIVQVELVQPEEHKDPEHLKVHRNPLSKVAHAFGHFGKQYALGVKDSVEPRNLGRETLPIAMSVGTQLVIANQIKKGIEGGFNQVGANLKQLAGGEAQLGANQLQIAQQMAFMQQEITALEGGAKVGSFAGHLAPGAVVKHSIIGMPRISAGISPETAISLPLQGNVGGHAEGGVILTAAVPGAKGGTLADRTVRTTAVNGTMIEDLNKGAPLENVGVDRNGYAVAMTPKQLEKARDYHAKSIISEAQLANASADFNKQIAAVSDALSTSPNATAFLNDLKMRYKYAIAYDQQGDHVASRAFVSDCKQDIDNLKRTAKAEHNERAIAQIDLLKQTANSMDGIEKHFAKAPSVVLALNSDRSAGSTG